jgi:hypothetical protein
MASKTLADGVRGYDPSLHLWADGAEKNRFIRLPSSTSIDTSDMNEWVFPVGTKVWKEFLVGGKRIETRYQEKRADGWFRTTYLWAADEQSAYEVTAGAKNVGGTGYDVPSQGQCVFCHQGRKDNVLGFEAVGLSTAAATGFTMRDLVREGLVTHPPSALLTIPGTPVEAAALGWLHANCGIACHNTNPNALASGTGLHMRLSAGQLESVQATDAYQTAVGMPSNFQPSPGAGFLRIKPGDVAHSAIPYRAGSRNDGAQMPPLGTQLPDAAGLKMIEDWIASM